MDVITNPVKSVVLWDNSSRHKSTQICNYITILVLKALQRKRMGFYKGTNPGGLTLDWVSGKVSEELTCS